jgi:hypothetical protein
MSVKVIVPLPPVDENAEYAPWICPHCGSETKGMFNGMYELFYKCGSSYFYDRHNEYDENKNLWYPVKSCPNAKSYLALEEISKWMVKNGYDELSNEINKKVEEMKNNG